MTVEFALAVVLLLMVVAGIIEFGVMGYDQITLTAAARQGARAGALAGLSPTQAETNAVAQADAAAAGIFSCGSPSATATDAGTPPVMTVKVSCPYRALTPIGSLAGMVGGGLNFNLTLAAQAEQPVEP